jgi:hypothetical protein
MFESSNSDISQSQNQSWNINLVSIWNCAFLYLFYIHHLAPIILRLVYQNHFRLSPHYGNRWWLDTHMKTRNKQWWFANNVTTKQNYLSTWLPKYKKAGCSPIFQWFCSYYHIKGGNGQFRNINMTTCLTSPGQPRENW